MKKIVNTVHELETPCFIIDEERLRNNTLQLQTALQTYFSHSIFSYSVKTNSLPWLLTYLKNSGCYAEVVSEDEYMLAEALGFSNGDIVYNGPLKSKETFFHALSKRNIINIDTNRELLWLVEFSQQNTILAKIGLRVNIDMEALLPGVTDYPQDGSRFGFDIENGEFESALAYLKSNNITLSGLHLHRTTKTRSVDGYLKLCRFAIAIAKNYGLDLEYIDIGGGFYGDKPNAPTYNDYFAGIKNVLQEYFDLQKLTIIVEPGNAIAASCFDFLSSIIDVKKIKQHYVVTIDGSRNDIDPFFHKDSYFYEIYIAHPHDEQIKKVKRQIIVGCSCLEYDRLFEMHDTYKLTTDNKILFKFVGAYTMALSPVFIRYFPNVYVYKEKYILIRPRWTYQKLILDT